MEAKRNYLKLMKSLRSALKIEFSEDWSRIYYQVFKCGIPILDKGREYRALVVYRKQIEKLLLGMKPVNTSRIDELLEIYKDKPIQYVIVLESYHLENEGKILGVSVDELKDKIDKLEV